MLVWIRRESAQGAPLHLLCKCHQTSSRTSEAGVVSKRSHAASGIVLQELQVVEQAGGSSLGEAVKHVCPAGLLLVAVGKLNVRVWQGGVFYRKLLQTNNEGILGRVGPAVVVCKFTSDTAKDTRSD